MHDIFNHILNKQSYDKSNFRNKSSFFQEKGALSRNEALEILGLTGTPSVSEINTAYHKLMKHLHPDKGGPPYFAQKLNQARDTLLK